MATNSAPPGSGPPPKPWERAGSASGPAPFKPPSTGSTSDVVESSGTAKPGEVVPTVNRTVAATANNTLSRPVPPRPWQQNYGSTYGGYGSGGMYGSSYGGYNSGGYGGSLYGNNSMYSSGYGGAGGLYGSSGMYGGGMYSSGYGGGPMGGYGGMGSMGGMGMGPYGNQEDPNNPFGPPSQPPGFWMSFLRVMGGVVNFFGRIAVLIDQNTQAFHMFMTALLQLFDRSGVLYGELARFVFRLFGIRTTPPRKSVDGGAAPPSIDAPKANNGGNSWDNVWGHDLAKGNGQ